MRQIGFGVLNVGAGQKTILKDFNVSEGRRTERMRLKLEIPVDNTDEALPHAFTLTHLIAALRVIFGVTTVRYGKGETRERDTHIDRYDLDTLRLHTVLMDEDDFTAIDVDGAAREFTEAGATSLAQVAAGGTSTVVCEVVVSYTYTRAGVKRRDLCPGTTQMRQCEVEVVRGQGFDAASKIGTYFIQGGQVSVIVLADDFRGDDEWHAPPRFYFDPATREKQSMGPGGRLLALCERTALLGASTLDQFQLRAELDDGKVDVLLDGVTPDDVLRDADRQIEESTADANALVAVLYRTALALDADEFPVGRRFVFEQYAQSPVVLDLAWLYIPLVEDAAAERIAVNVANRKGENLTNFKLVRAIPLRRPEAPNTTAATSGFKIVREGGSDYAGTVGQVVTRQPDGLVVRRIDVPGAIASGARGAVLSAKDKAEADAMAAKVSAGIARYVPGDCFVSSSQSALAQSVVARRVRTAIGF